MSEGATDGEALACGSCQCGATRFEAPAPTHANYCHCSMCRRATGSVVAAIAWAPAAQVRWTRPPRTYRSSPAAVRGFCGDCGSPLFLQYDGEDAIGLMLGAFDQPEPFPPGNHYGVEGRLSWVDIGRGLPERETEAELAARVRGDG